MQIDKKSKPSADGIKAENYERLRMISNNPELLADWRRRMGIGNDLATASISDSHRRKEVAALFGELARSLGGSGRNDGRPPMARPRDARLVAASRKAFDERLSSIAEEYSRMPALGSDELIRRLRETEW